MNLNINKNELQNLISGKSGTSHDAIIQSVSQYLRRSQKAGPMAEEKHKNKYQEEKRLITYAKQRGILMDSIPSENYISHGAEQRVYFGRGNNVLKLNDVIYYASWEDYFHNLLLHNYFFADTAYTFKGFYLENGKLYSVVEQAYVKADTITDLNSIISFLSSNGFENTRRHDYQHPELGLIIEDLHDENVLTCRNLLYFIDTVFYIMPEKFWK